ncbi:AAA family ATPase [Candidatus Phytoplasma pruni]|uniref:AAA family ATPase n=1 Tax=Candidatus Phytoplasma pruni TaxID=479893 RepID=A0A851HD32_9MOLU|nr:AAA family ATPase [Candidatus Phytoplasma pruni]NWN45991.1 AAA family ATPase [Candidatus Phytoplasma pruni]
MNYKNKNRFNIFPHSILILLFIIYFSSSTVYAVIQEEYKVVKNSANKIDYYPNILKKLEELNPGKKFILENPQNNKVYYNSKNAENNTVFFDKSIEYNQGDIKNQVTPLLVYFNGGTRDDNINNYDQLIKEKIHSNKVFIFKGLKGGGDNISLIIPPSKKQKKTFDDIAGLDEAKDQLREIAHYFNNKELYKQFNIKAPKGALLYAPPGTGKTILMEALANESGVPFIIADGPEFVKQYVGAGPEMLQEKFKEADKLAKESKKGCIIFIDEIDTIATKRTSDSQAAGLSHNKMVNTLLTLLDGMNSNPDVVIIGATNKDDILDEALTRPGRLDRKIYVGLPDKTSKIKLFEVFLKKYKENGQLDDNINYESLSDKATDFSGATISKVVNEVAFNIIQDILKEEIVEFIIDYYDNPQVQNKRAELQYGRIDSKTDLTKKEELLNYSATDLDKIAEKIKNIIFPNEKDYYVGYILKNKHHITSELDSDILQGNIEITDLNDENSLQNKRKDVLEIVVKNIKNFLISQKFKITEKYLNESIEQHLFGRKMLQRQYSEQEKKIVAANETGHALIQYLQKPDLFYKNTVELSNNPTAHNYVEEHSNFKTREQILKKVTFLLAGRAAEDVLIGSVSTKSQKDLEEAKKIIEEMVYNQGIEDNHYVSFNTFPSKDHIFYHSCNKLLNETYNKAKIHIQNNQFLAKEIQDKLLKENYINKQTMDELSRKNSLNKSDILKTDINPTSKKGLAGWIWLTIVLLISTVILWIVVLIIKKRNRKEV